MKRCRSAWNAVTSYVRRVQSLLSLKATLSTIRFRPVWTWLQACLMSSLDFTALATAYSTLSIVDGLTIVQL